MNLKSFLTDTGLCDENPGSLAVDFYAFLICIRIDEKHLKDLAYPIFKTQYPASLQTREEKGTAFEDLLLAYERGVEIPDECGKDYIPGVHSYGELQKAFIDHKKMFPELVESHYAGVFEVTEEWEEGMTCPLVSDNAMEEETIQDWYVRRALSTHGSIDQFNTDALEKVKSATDFMLKQKFEGMKLTYQEFIDGLELFFIGPVFTERLKFVRAVSNVTPESKILQRPVTSDEIYDLLRNSNSPSYISLYNFIYVNEFRTQ